MMPEFAHASAAWRYGNLASRNDHLGPGIATTAHRHHCVQVVMTMRGSLLVRGLENGWRKCGAVFVRPDALHEVDARGSTVLIGFYLAGFPWHPHRRHRDHHLCARRVGRPRQDRFTEFLRCT
jgi:hypothetical protein